VTQELLLILQAFIVSTAAPWQRLEHTANIFSLLFLQVLLTVLILMAVITKL